MEEREQIESAFTRAIYYAHLVFSTNMADPARGALVARLQERGATLETKLLFFGLEWAAVDDATADAVLADEALDHWRHALRSLRKFRPYLLVRAGGEDPRREGRQRGARPGRGCSRSCSARCGSSSTASRSDSRPRWRSSTRADRDVRAAAATAVTAALEPGLRTRAYIYNQIVLDKSVDDRLRSYPTWITSRNLANETTDEAVQALIEAATARYDVPQRYYRLKARLLGLERLEYYDRFAPVGQTTTRRWSGRAPTRSWSRRTRRSRRSPATSSRASSTRAGSTRRLARTSAAARSAPRTSPASTRTSS